MGKEESGQENLAIYLWGEEIMEYPHWQYFIVLDSDLDNVSRYVQINSDNYETYSIEFVHIFLAICSEIDTVAKILCKKFDTKFDPLNKKNNIDLYRSIITNECPNLCTMKILVPRYGLDFVPWAEWGQNKNPSWWNCYNNVKHDRDRHFKQANLENVLNALAGLFVLLCYLHFYKKTVYMNNLPSPKLLLVNQPYMVGTSFGSTLHYITPDG